MAGPGRDYVGAAILALVYGLSVAIIVACATGACDRFLTWAWR